MCLPSEELRDRVGAEDGGLVPIGDAGDVGLKVLVRDDGDELLERLTVGPPVEAVAAQVLHVGIAGEDLGQDAALNLISVRGHVLDELQRPPVLLGEVVAGGKLGKLFGSLGHG